MSSEEIEGIEKNAEYYPVVESILFTMGKSVEIPALSAALELDESRTRRVLEELAERYRENDRGIQLLFLNDSVQLSTKAQFYPYLIRIASQPKKHVLTEAVLETLSIIAYKQPVTRSDIERIRGVKSDHAVSKLIEYQLIEEAGRLDAPGRPVLFVTTEEFLRCFGISSVSELPEAEADQVEEFREEAEKEIPVTV